MRIGQRLRELRESKNLSQGDIEKATGLIRFLVLIQRDGITTPHLAPLHYGGVDPDRSSIVLGCRPQDAGVPWEVTLRQCCHHAARTGAGYAETNGIPYSEHVADPGILHKIPVVARGLDDKVWAEPPDLEATIRIQ